MFDATASHSNPEEVAHGSIKCARCNQLKSMASFGRMARWPNRLSKTCKACIQARQRQWKETNAAVNRDRIPDPSLKKRCPVCLEEKSLDQFQRRAKTKSGVNGACVSCCRSRDRERYKRDIAKRREQSKWAQIKKKFGLSRQQWEALLSAQDGKCAICLNVLEVRSLKGGALRSCVDHDHKTGAIRGILCAKCNQGIGLLGDSQTILAAAIKYLRKHERVG